MLKILISQLSLYLSLYIYLSFCACLIRFTTSLNVCWCCCFLACSYCDVCLSQVAQLLLNFSWPCAILLITVQFGADTLFRFVYSTIYYYICAAAAATASFRLQVEKHRSVQQFEFGLNMAPTTGTGIFARMFMRTSRSWLAVWTVSTRWSRKLSYNLSLSYYGASVAA